MHPIVKSRCISGTILGAIAGYLIFRGYETWVYSQGAEAVRHAQAQSGFAGAGFTQAFLNYVQAWSVMGGAVIGAFLGYALDLYHARHNK